MSKVVVSCCQAKSKSKSLQHEYKCSFDNGVGSLKFEFSKNNDYRPCINESQWLMKNSGSLRNLGPRSTTFF